MKSKPRRGAPNAAMAVSPASAPGFRTVAVSCDIERPRRSSAHVDLHRSAAATCPANSTVIVRSVCVGSPSSRSMARTAIAATMPPWGTDGQLPGIADRRREAPVARRRRAPGPPIPWPSGEPTDAVATSVVDFVRMADEIDHRRWVDRRPWDFGGKRSASTAPTPARSVGGGPSCSAGAHLRGATTRWCSSRPRAAPRTACRPTSCS